MKIHFPNGTSFQFKKKDLNLANQVLKGIIELTPADLKKGFADERSPNSNSNNDNRTIGFLNNYSKKN